MAIIYSVCIDMINLWWFMNYFIGNILVISLFCLKNMKQWFHWHDKIVMIHELLCWKYTSYYLILFEKHQTMNSLEFNFFQDEQDFANVKVRIHYCVCANYYFVLFIFSLLVIWSTYFMCLPALLSGVL